MKPISRFFSNPIQGTVFGVEVEVEDVKGVSGDGVAKSGFQMKADHSLRNGIEFVTDKPECLDATLNKVDKFYDELHKGTSNFSFRTSIHVHVNVQDMGFDQIAKYVLAYSSLEMLLSEYCGRLRMNNRFCLFVHNNFEYTAHLFSYLKKDCGDQGRATQQEFGKLHRYSAVNLHSLKTFGTLEFRAMRGTHDKEVVKNWIRVLECLKKTSQTIPVEAMLDYRSHFTTIDNFLEAMIPDPQLRGFFLFAKKAAKVKKAQDALKLSVKYAEKAVERHMRTLKEKAAIEQNLNTGNPFWTLVTSGIITEIPKATKEKKYPAADDGGDNLRQALADAIQRRISWGWPAGQRPAEPPQVAQPLRAGDIIVDDIF